MIHSRGLSPAKFQIAQPRGHGERQCDRACPAGVAENAGEERNRDDHEDQHDQPDGLHAGGIQSGRSWVRAGFGEQALAGCLPSPSTPSPCRRRWRSRHERRRA